MESILACSLFTLLLLGLHWVWHFGELKQLLNTEAFRLAVWKSTAYNTNAATDPQSLYSIDADLVSKVFRNLKLKPSGARQSKTNGSTALLQDHLDWMTTAARFLPIRLKVPLLVASPLAPIKYQVDL
ncbi:MAG: hypothetical protein H7240_06190 [Glaciimonas sp.]|nr:hypothetical protein [Glaciimonas sp.]